METEFPCADLMPFGYKLSAELPPSSYDNGIELIDLGDSDDDLDLENELKPTVYSTLLNEKSEEKTEEVVEMIDLDEDSGDEGDDENDEGNNSIEDVTPKQTTQASAEFSVDDKLTGNNQNADSPYDNVIDLSSDESEDEVDAANLVSIANEEKVQNNEEIEDNQNNENDLFGDLTNESHSFVGSTEAIDALISDLSLMKSFENQSESLSAKSTEITEVCLCYFICRLF